MADFVGAQYTIDELKSVLNDATNGLAAIKTAEGTIDGRLTNGSTGLSPIKSAIDTANGYLTNGTYGLNAIKTAATNAQLSVKSVQRGNAALPYVGQVDAYGANWYGTVNISSVNTSKSIILVDCVAYNALGRFNSNTQIYLSANLSAVSWQVIEFY